MWLSLAGPHTVPRRQVVLSSDKTLQWMPLALTGWKALGWLRPQGSIPVGGDCPLTRSCRLPAPGPEHGAGPLKPSASATLPGGSGATSSRRPFPLSLWAHICMRTGSLLLHILSLLSPPFFSVHCPHPTQTSSEPSPTTQTAGSGPRSRTLR